MKKRLAIQPDYKKIQSDEIDKVITQLKKGGGITERDTNKIRESLYKSLENDHLNLSHCCICESCRISEENLKYILPLLSVLNITSLDLEYNQIGDVGAKALAKALEESKSIKELNLNNNQIRTGGAKALAKALKINKSLKGLYIGNNHIGDAEAKELADALKINKSLTHLVLWRNQIGSEGAIALEDALTINTSLTHLNLLGNNLGYDLGKTIHKEIDINSEIATFKELKEDYIIRWYLAHTRLEIVNSDVDKLIVGFLINSRYQISKDAVSKLQTISKQKHAATHNQKIVRGRQVSIIQDTNPRTICDSLSLIIQTTTNCFSLNKAPNIKK